MSKVQTVVVDNDEDGMRVDRFLAARFPGLNFVRVQSMIRKGELRVDGGRIKANARLSVGQSVRVPPIRIEPAGPPRRDHGGDAKTRDFLKSITLYEDDDMMVIDKPMGLAVQGGSGTTRHVDGMLEEITAKDGQRARLVHRLANRHLRLPADRQDAVCRQCPH